MNNQLIQTLRQKFDARICAKLAKKSCPKCYGTGIIGLRISAEGSMVKGQVNVAESVPCSCVINRMREYHRSQSRKITGLDA